MVHCIDSHVLRLKLTNSLTLSLLIFSYLNVTTEWHCIRHYLASAAYVDNIFNHYIVNVCQSLKRVICVFKRLVIQNITGEYIYFSTSITPDNHVEEEAA